MQHLDLFESKRRNGADEERRVGDDHHQGAGRNRGDATPGPWVPRPHRPIHAVMAPSNGAQGRFHTSSSGASRMVYSSVATWAAVTTKSSAIPIPKPTRNHRMRTRLRPTSSLSTTADCRSDVPVMMSFPGEGTLRIQRPCIRPPACGRLSPTPYTSSPQTSRAKHDARTMDRDATKGSSSDPSLETLTQALWAAIRLIVLDSQQATDERPEHPENRIPQVDDDRDWKSGAASVGGRPYPSHQDLEANQSKLSHFRLEGLASHRTRSVHEGIRDPSIEHDNQRISLDSNRQYFAR